jgi:hypothetical protein
MLSTSLASLDYEYAADHRHQLFMASDHGLRQWPQTKASNHGRSPWPQIVALYREPSLDGWRAESLASLDEAVDIPGGVIEHVWALVHA